MADEKKPAVDKPAPSGDPFADLVFMIFAVLLVVYALNGIVSFFNSKNTSGSNWRDLTPRGLLLKTTRPISSLGNPINSKFVVTSYKADVFRTPGGSQVATKKLEDKGTITGGPAIVDGEKYWQVKFDDGTTGWMKESDIANIPQKLTNMNEMSTLIGTEVETNRETDILSSPGGEKISSKPVGQKATIIEGPIIKNDTKYWHISFDDGTDGWVDEESLDSLFGKKEPLSKKPTLIGGTVVSNENGIPVYDSPNGNIVATENKGSVGKIIEGPLVVGGVKFWYVRFENGDEGWVNENDIDYRQADNSSLFVKVVLFIWRLFSITKYLLILLSLVSIGCIVFLVRSLNSLAEEQRKLIYPNLNQDFVPDMSKAVVNIQWENVFKHSESENQNDWRQAIMEADIMLADLLNTMGLQGDTIGDKLKSVEPSDFRTLNNAWEAHKVRNNIAHEGMSFVLTQRETRRVIGLYESVFDEFKII